MLECLRVPSENSAAHLKQLFEPGRYGPAANKCAIASRVDCYGEAPTTKFGECLKDQMEERLKFLAQGTKPRKNKEVMDGVIKELDEVWKYESCYYESLYTVCEHIYGGIEEEGGGMEEE